MRVLLRVPSLPPLPSLLSPPVASRILAALVISCAPVAAAGGGADEAGAATSASRSGGSIYLGLNLAVREKDRTYPVVGAGKGTVWIDADGRQRELPVDRAHFEIGHDLKFSGVIVAVERFDVRTVATGRSRPGEASAGPFLRTDAGVQRDGLLGSMQNAERSLATATTPVEKAEAQRAVDQAFREYESASFEGERAGRAEEDVMFSSSRSAVDAPPDTVEVVAVVSSPVPFERGFAVLVTEIDPPARQGKSFHSVSTVPLERLDATPRRIRFRQAGLPPGFRVAGTILSLYAEGEEVATTRSKMGLGVNLEQAHEHFVLQHILGHKGESSGAGVRLLTPRAELRRRLDPAILGQTVHVLVDAEGMPLRLSLDENGDVPLPAPLQAALRDVCFVPAVGKGQPVEGRLSFRLEDLVR